MAAEIPIDPVAFRQDFQTMFDIACQPDVAWYNEPQRWRGSRMPYEVWRVTNPLDEPFHEASWRYQDFNYDVLPIAEPEAAHVVTQRSDRFGQPDISLGPRHSRGRVRRLTPLLTVSACVKHAPDGQSLVAVSDALVAHVNAGMPDTERPASQFATLRRAIGQLVGRSLLLGAGPDGAYGTAEEGSASLPASLAKLDRSRASERARQYVSADLEIVLRQWQADTTIGSLRKAMSAVEPWFVMHAVSAMQDVGIVKPDFWWRNGVESDLVFDKKVGDIALHGVEASLVADCEATLARVSAEKVQSITRSYVSNILISYAADPNRNQIALKKIIDILASERSKKMGTGLTDSITELRPLISLSNGLAKGLNYRLETAGVTDPRLRLPILNNNELWNVPPALLRVLYATVRPDVSPEAMATMFERDIAHVTVLESIRSHLRLRATDANLADTLLRYPDVDPTELPTLMGAARNPNAGHRQDAWKRAKRRAARGVRGYGIFTPGAGALS